MPRVKYWFTIIGVFFGMFYGFGSRKYELGEAFGQSVSSGLVQLLISFGVIIGVIILFRLFSRLLLFGFLKKEVDVPIDSFVSRGIELLNSIPRLLLIITISSIVTRSIWIVMVIIGLTSWTGIARFTRAEFLEFVL